MTPSINSSQIIFGFKTNIVYCQIFTELTIWNFKLGQFLLKIVSRSINCHSLIYMNTHFHDIFLDSIMNFILIISMWIFVPLINLYPFCICSNVYIPTFICILLMQFHGLNCYITIYTHATIYETWEWHFNISFVLNCPIR